mgnify:CR=1 FL=1
MPRIRTFKPEFFTSYSVGQLSRDARLLLFGLISQADDEGRFRATPRLLAGAIFPYDADAIRVVKRCLPEIAKQGIAQLWSTRDGEFGVLTSFPRHQRIDHPSKSKLPNPPKETETERISREASENVPRTLTEGSGIKDQGSRIKDQGAGSKKQKRKAKTPAQPELPAMPPPPPPEPRAQSLGERVHAEFLRCREEVLYLANNGEVEPDEPTSPAYVNTAVAPMLAALAPVVGMLQRRDPPIEDPQLKAFQYAIEDFLAMPWAAQCKPPFPFRAFTSKKIWSQFETVTDLQPTEEEMREGA